MGHELYSWYVRDTLEVLERLKKAEGLGRLAERLPDRLKPYANLARLRSAPPHATIPLDLAEEFILAIEGILGDGSGQLLEKISNELVAAAIARGRVSLRLGDFVGSLERLRAVVERPFVDIQPVFEVVATETGVEISVCAPKRPRLARILRYWCLGAVRAAERLAQDPSVPEFQTYAELVGDRAQIWVRYLRGSKDASEPLLNAARRRSTPAPRRSLQLEVERILRSSTPAPGPVAAPTEGFAGFAKPKTKD